MLTPCHYCPDKTYILGHKQFPLYNIILRLSVCSLAVRWITGMAGRPSGKVTAPSCHKGSNKMPIFLKCNISPKSGLTKYSAQGRYVQPSVNWMVSVIQFSKHTIICLQNIMWQLYYQRKCYKLQLTTFKTAHSKPIFLCVLSSLLRTATLSLSYTFSVTYSVCITSF